MDRYFSLNVEKKDVLEKFPLCLWYFCYISMVLSYVKYILHNINFRLVQYDARKLQELPGFFVCLKCFIFCKDLRNRGPPILKYEI